MLLLSVFVKAQIFTETFNSFTWSWAYGTAGWNFGGAASGYDTVNSGTYNLTRSAGFSVNWASETVSGGIIDSAGTYITFDGSSEYMTSTNAIFNPGTDDFWILGALKTPASMPTSAKYIINKYRAATDNGWSIFFYDNIVYSKIEHDPVIAPGVTVPADKSIFFANLMDRSGNGTFRVWTGDSLLAIGTADISSKSGVNITSATAMTIGTYAYTPANNEFDGWMDALWFGRGTLPTLEQICAEFFLADGWYSDTDSSGAIRDNFGWHQGVTCGVATPQITIAIIGTEGLQPADYTDYATITGDSTTYTIQFPLIDSLNSDAIRFDIDSGDMSDINHALPDTVFQEGYGLQVKFDCWSNPGTTSNYYVLFDNVVVTTYLLNPEISSSPASKNFGNIVVGDSSSQVFTISNTGADPLTVTDINWVTAAQVSVSDTAFTVDTSGTQNITVWFKPQSIGAKLDTLTIVNNDQDEGNFTIPLSANGILPTAGNTFRKYPSANSNKFKGW
jgi:hypothetical protein